MTRNDPCTAFAGETLLASGPLASVALAAKRASDADATILVFADRTGRPVDLDLRGSDDDILSRLPDTEISPTVTGRSVGRPKLGVVAREITLLPRHWDWLSGQPGGPSATLRRLVDVARATGAPDDLRRQAREAADRFMQAMLGDRPAYEDASRALYAGDEAIFRDSSEAWPTDLRDHARRLAGPAFLTATARG